MFGKRLQLRQIRPSALVASATGVLLLLTSFEWQWPRDNANQPADYRIDLNSAPWYELTLADGIGDTLALRIVENRTVNGPFGSVADLVRVRGIGEKSVEKIRPFVSTSDRTDSKR